MSRESVDDATRLEQLTNQVRTPPVRLTIVQAETSVTITDDQGLSRMFHPNGRQEGLSIGTVPLLTTARWDAASLVVLYQVEEGRQLQYTYASAANPPRLLVDIKFLERGRGDEVRLTYERADDAERAGASTTPSPSGPPNTSSRATPTIAGAEVPATPGDRPAVQPPGSELHGLATIGTVVDELSPQAAACGLDRGAIKTSVSKALADAGFKVRPTGDEDTYVHIGIVTSRLSDGVCVSRYDASLYTLTDATLSYQKSLVAVQVLLLHRGGMSGGAPAAHASSVLQTLTQYVSEFITQIRDANK